MSRPAARISLRSPGGKAPAPYWPDGKKLVLFERFTPGYVDYGDMKQHELFRNRDIGLLKPETAIETMEEETEEEATPLLPSIT